MKFYSSGATCCEADQTVESAVVERSVQDPNLNYRQGKRAKMIWHRRGEMRFWHWSDQNVEPTPTLESQGIR